MGCRSNASNERYSESLPCPTNSQGWLFALCCGALLAIYTIFIGYIMRLANVIPSICLIYYKICEFHRFVRMFLN